MSKSFGFLLLPELISDKGFSTKILHVITLKVMLMMEWWGCPDLNRGPERPRLRA